MTLSEADIEQFIFALHEDPKLKDRVRNAILSDDFLALPGIVERLGERMEQLTIRVDRLGERMDQLTIRVDQLGERMDQLTGQVQQLGERMDQLTIRVDHLGERMDQLTGQVQQLALKMERFDGRLGNLEGRNYERDYRDNVISHLAPFLKKPVVVVPANIDELDAAFQSGRMSLAQWREIHRLDLLVHGTPRRSAEPEVWWAMELSLVVDKYDVERAANRAATLREFGVAAVPVVDGRGITSDAIAEAQVLGVSVLVEREATGAA